MGERFDAVVIGAGPAGEAAASRLNRQDLRTVLIERELVGGERAYWACIPSKTLLPTSARGALRSAAHGRHLRAGAALGRGRRLPRLDDALEAR